MICCCRRSSSASGWSAAVLILLGRAFAETRARDRTSAAGSTAGCVRARRRWSSLLDAALGRLRCLENDDRRPDARRARTATPRRGPASGCSRARRCSRSTRRRVVPWMPTPGAFSPIQRVPSGFAGPGGTGFRPLRPRVEVGGYHHGFALLVDDPPDARPASGRSPARSRRGTCARASRPWKSRSVFAARVDDDHRPEARGVRFGATRVASAAQRRARAVAQQPARARRASSFTSTASPAFAAVNTRAVRGRADHRGVDRLRGRSASASAVDDAQRPSRARSDGQRDPAVRRRGERGAHRGIDARRRRRAAPGVDDRRAGRRRRS